MNPERFAEMQLQMQQNQQDLGSYLKDLEDWTKGMKVKEEEMLNSSDPKKASFPPVRNKSPAEASGKAPTNGTKAKSNGKSKPRINSYDYRAWDRFDVDAALKSESSGSEDGDESSPPPMPSTSSEAEANKKALALKEKGNAYFNQKKFSEAIEYYSSALEIKPRDATFLTNRAICYLKLDKFEEADEDCSHALAVDHRNAKACFRRATARVGLGKMAEAKEDFQSVLKLDPTNKLAIQEIERIEESERISKAVELMVEQEAASKIPEWFPIPSEHAADFDIMSAKSWKGEADTTKMTTIPIREVSNLNHLWKSPPPDMSFTGKDQSEYDNRQEAPRFMYAPPPNSWRSIPEIPNTPFQFQNDLRTLRGDSEHLYEYLKKLDASKLPELFGLSLESSVLADIVECFSEHEMDETTAAFFTNLQRVNRYSTVALFLDSNLKPTLDKLTACAQSKTGKR